MKPILLRAEETRDGTRLSFTCSYEDEKRSPTPKQPQKCLAKYLKDLATRVENGEAIKIGFAEESMKQVYRDESLIQREIEGGIDEPS